ncbi:MAG: hypothetical protein JKY77_06420 [Rhizobiaceae bacterium]|nr:hypothetical protein [Rhizobiaceae bacterium]
MANRTGTYIAFDGLGEADPSKSDFRYYSIMQKWTAVEHIDFKFVNSHEKTAAVRDTSLKSTLMSRIRERLNASKNCLVILSDDTRATGSMLSYEIEMAVDYYEIPLIITHTGYAGIYEAKSLSQRWPNALTDRINNFTARAIHIPFKKGAILDAINQFTVQKSGLEGALHCYSKKAQIEMGCIEG